MTTIDIENESAEEVVLREFLQARLLPGESLLAYTKANYNPGSFTNKEYFVGLTSHSLLLVRRDQPERPYRIDNRFIQKITFEKPPLTARRAIQVNLGRESLRMNVLQKWQARASQLVELYAQAAASSEALGGLSAQQSLQHITDLIDLGLIRAAEEVRKQILAQNAMVSSLPDISSEITDGGDNISFIEHSLRQIKETRLAMWVGAGIFILELVFVIWMAFLGYAKIGFGIVLAGLAIIGLLRGQVSWRGQALGLAWLTAGVNIVINAINLSWPDVIMWLAFGLAMWLVLAGKASRLRTIAAAAIFGIGFAGVFGLIILLAMFSPKSYLTLVNGSDTFQDSFDSNRGWATHNGAEAVVEIENKVFAIHPIQTEYTSLAFPPVAFQPNIAEFDAWPAAGFEQELGGFGIICHYQDDNNLMLVEIFPPRQGAAVLVAKNGDINVLTDPTVQPIDNLKASGANRFKVDCTGDQISLYVNGEQVIQINNPGQPAAEDEKIAFFVSTVAETGPNGYKILFDNIQLSK